MEIAEKIHLELDFKTRYYPVFTPPERDDKEEYLRAALRRGHYHPVYAGAAGESPGKISGPRSLQVVQDRLEYELDIIISKGMCDYILIVYDFIAWAKKRGIPMGPGRGSGAGSIILFLIGITDIEPLRFNLVLRAVYQS